MTTLQLLNALVSMKTITGAKKECSCALTFVAEQLNGQSLFFRRFTHKGYESLLVSTKKTLRPDVLLAAHVDVVPASDSLFSLRTTSQRLYGRGVYDMKFAIACFITVLQRVGTTKNRPNIALLITSDEETGGDNGTRYLLSEGLRPATVLLPDGGNNWDIELSAKGIAQIRVEVRGKATHASRPWNGVNAIERLTRILQNVYATTQNTPSGHLTVSAGTIRGGTAVNTVAEHASLEMDVRFTTRNHFERMKKKLNTLCTTYGGRWSILAHGVPYSIAKNHPDVRILHRILTTYCRTSGFTHSHGASDARHFSPYAIPVLLVTPPGGGHHSDVEWLLRSGLDTFVSVTYEFIQRKTRH